MNNFGFEGGPKAAPTMRSLEKLQAEISKRHRLGKSTAELYVKFQGLHARISLGEAASEKLLRATTFSEIREIFETDPRAKEHLIEKVGRNPLGQGPGIVEHTMLTTWSTLNFYSSQDVVAVGLGKAFCDTLMATDYQETVVSGLEVPFPGPFAFRLPRNTFHLYDPGRGGVGAWAAVDLITLMPLVDDQATGIDNVPVLNPRTGQAVENNRIPMKGLAAGYWTGLDENSQGLSDDFYTDEMLPLHFIGDDTPPLTLGQIERGSVNSGGHFQEHRGKTAMLLREDDGTETMLDLMDLKNVVYGSLLYLNMHNPSLVRVSNRKPVTVPELVEPPKRAVKLKSKSAKKPKPWVYVVVSEDVDLIHRTAYKHLVKGHFRNQPHGPKLSLRKLIWIRPHYRNEGGPGGRGGSYEIDGLPTA